MDRSHRIMVVEDSETQALKLRYLLEGKGWQVVWAASAERALEQINQSLPDVMVVDYQLPGMSGEELCRKIRSNTPTRSIALLMLKGDDAQDARVQALECCADDCLSKSADADLFLLRVGTLLRKSPVQSSILGPDEAYFRRARLLAIDDSPTYLEFLTEELKNEGYTVAQAASGSEGLKRIANEAFDCVLVDLMMPDMDGVAVCRRLIEMRLTLSNAPVVLMLTAHENKEDMTLGLEGGADDFVGKSSDMAVLKGRIRALLRRKFFQEENQRILGELKNKELETLRAVAEKEAAEAKAALSNQLAQTARELAESNRELQNENAERRRAEEALQNQTRLLQSILDSIGDGVVAADESGKLLVVNPAAEQMLGLGLAADSSGEGLAAYDLYLPDKVTRFPADQLPLARAMRGESVEDAEIFVRHPKRPGGLVVSVTGRPLKAENAVRHGGVVAFRDVTESKRAEERLRSLNSQLEAANKELESFSYSVSHDLRAPLRHIGGFLGLLQKSAGAGLDAKSQNYLAIISDSTKQMGTLIDDLLSFCRMGRTELRSTRASFDQLVKDTITSLSPETEGRDIEWNIEPLPEVQADAALLQQVWVNLLSNALKYSRTRSHTRIEIGCKPNTNGEHVFYVRDNGVGFDMKYADKLFGVFQRLHEAEEFEGTGIGLANVQRIVSRHGGRTWAEGVVDGGATFFFSLPKSHESKS